MSFEVEQMSAELTKFHLAAPEGVSWPMTPVFHRFTGRDKGLPHCHPFGFWSTVLHGEYWEKVYYAQADGTWLTEIIHRKANTTFWINATHIHEIIEIGGSEVWTMILPGPKEREWGFWREDGAGLWFRPHTEEHFILKYPKP